MTGLPRSEGIGAGDRASSNAEKINQLRQEAAKLCGREVIPVGDSEKIGRIREQMDTLCREGARELQPTIDIIDKLIFKIFTTQQSTIRQSPDEASNIRKTIAPPTSIPSAAPSASAPTAAPGVTYKFRYPQTAATPEAPAPAPQAPSRAEEVEKKVAAAAEPTQQSEAFLKFWKEQLKKLPFFFPNCLDSKDCLEVLDIGCFLISASDLKPEDQKRFPNVIKFNLKILQTTGSGSTHEVRYGGTYLEYTPDSPEGTLKEFILLPDGKRIDLGKYRDLDNFLYEKRALNPQKDLHIKLTANPKVAILMMQSEPCFHNISRDAAKALLLKKESAGRQILLRPNNYSHDSFTLTYLNPEPGLSAEKRIHHDYIVLKANEGWFLRKDDPWNTKEEKGPYFTLDQILAAHYPDYQLVPH